VKLGITYPHAVLGFDPEANGRFIAELERIGYDYIRVGEHILGVDPETRPGWAELPSPSGSGTGAYDYRDVFFDPFVHLGWLANFVTTLGCMTSTLTLPLRQTALVAKQAAQVDILWHGRLVLGVAVGWNAAEFHALGQNFTDRGARVEEQIEVLRELWTRDLVDVTGKWHTIDAMGINPLPRQRPIPIWIGGGPGSPVPTGTAAAQPERVLRRVARLADGWFPGTYLQPDAEGRAVVARLHELIREAGREEKDVAVHAAVRATQHPGPAQWADVASAWKSLGASYLSFTPLADTPERQLESAAQFADVVQPLLGQAGAPIA
jgi:probable F420-dependent oxidoreductase